MIPDCGQTKFGKVIGGLTAKKKSHICRYFCSALGRTRTCGLLIRRGTLRLFIGPVASCLAHNNGCFAWPLTPVDPSEPAGIPSRRWYRRWYGKCPFGDSLLVRKAARRSRLDLIIGHRERGSRAALRNVRSRRVTVWWLIYAHAMPDNRRDPV